MALVLKDRVQETSTTTGTGTFTLNGAVTQFQTFSSAIGNGNTTYYTAYTAGGTDWEVGIGTVGAGTLTRDTILASSNSGNIVTFGAGTKYIFGDYPAGKAVYLDASGSISQPIVNISGITGAISTVDTVTFDTGYTTTLTTGQLGWDGNNTLGIGMSGGNIVQEIGLQSYIYGKATSAITKGQLIKKTGANGSSGVITFAPTTANMTNGTDIIGIAAENIALNGFGYIISIGNLKGFNTSGSSSSETWANGDTLYYNPSGNGLMTNVKPSAPNIKTEVAVVINAGTGGSGSVAVEIIHGSVLGGTDSNVQITSPTGGQTLIYDQTNQYWKNANLTAGTAISVTNGTGGTITIANTGVTALSAGTGISLSGSTGSITVTNSAPDQTVTLTAGTGISTSGTYPSFTITNTAPDQTVAITAGTGISVTGTYPNFTVTNTSPSSGGTVTAVSISSSNGFAGTSSGGATPALTISTSVTGVIKGNGTAISAATAGTDYVAPATATNFTALQTFTGSSSVAGAKLFDVLEGATISATAATGTINYDVTTQAVLYYTSNASANWTVNFRGSSGTSLNTLMATGESMTLAFLVTQGSVAYYNNSVQIDGTTSGVTMRWLGGAPTAGNASGIDSYRYLITKTASATFTVLASLTQFKA